MRALNHKTALLLVMACLSMTVWACSGGDNDAGDGGPGNGQQTSSFSATVLDSDGNPVQGATVELARGVSDTTNSSGQTSFSALDASSDAVVTANAPGHMSRTETYPLTAGASGSAQLPLVAHDTTQTIDASSGGTVSNSDGAEVDIPANGLVDANGDPISGDVDVSLTYLDVSNEEERKAAPGDWSARQMDGTDAQLESYGVIGVDIGDGNGGEADLASGETSDITIPIPSNVQQNADQTMGLYSFDEDTGEWVEEGTLSLNQAGDAYTGTVDHFSSWNADKPMETVCYRVRLVDSNGNPISGAFIRGNGVDYNGSDGGRTNANGYAEVGARIGSEVEFTTSNPGGYFEDYDLQQTETRNTPSQPSANCGPNSPTVTLTTTGTEGDDDGGNGDGNGNGNGDGDGDGNGGTGDPGAVSGDYSGSSSYVDSVGCTSQQVSNRETPPSGFTLTETTLPGGGSNFAGTFDMTSGDLSGLGFVFQPEDAPDDPDTDPTGDDDFSCPYDDEFNNIAQNNFSNVFGTGDLFFVGNMSDSNDETGYSLLAPFEGGSDLSGMGLVSEDPQADCPCQHLYQWNASQQ